MDEPITYTAVVLAAQRQGAADPLAEVSGGRHKCLIDLHGRPMIAWVLDALLSTPRIAQVRVSIEDAALLEGMSEFDAAVRDGRMTIEISATNLYASVLAGLGGPNAPRCPAIVTTADNPLLTREALDHFLDAVERAGVDAAIAMTRADTMRAKYPDGQRRFYRFKDDHYSNCNLYALTSPRAAKAARIFEGGGQFGKKAIRMLRAFGVINVLFYRLGLLRLSDCAIRLSRGFGIRVGFVDMPFAESPIDVDNERTLRIAREIIAKRSSNEASSHRPQTKPKLA